MVEEALATWEPRILLEEVAVEDDYRAACTCTFIFATVIKSTYDPRTWCTRSRLEQR